MKLLLLENNDQLFSFNMVLWTQLIALRLITLTKHQPSSSPMQDTTSGLVTQEEMTTLTVMKHLIRFKMQKNIITTRSKSLDNMMFHQ